ncbi:MAG: rhodanese-like domain-containing protein [Clostridia bacterium]|nr:rhodanese-like domain-containing protein [Clostridia bacterium]
MKKALVLLLILVLGCTFASVSGCDNSEDREMTYTQITATEAKALMDSEEDFIILDVRTDAEYAEGHIADAVLIPHEEITAKAEEVLLDKDQLILVYCRSGRRSKIAAEALVALGYTNVKEFGGIIDWPYEVVQ